jgi:uncharacterized membrane protein
MNNADSKTSLDVFAKVIKNKYFIFFSVVIINIFLKSFFSGHTPFNYDEMISIKNTKLDFGHIKHEAEWDNNPPFFYYCLWVWHKVIPVSEFSSRFLTVVFMSLGIGLSFLFSLKYFDFKTAFFSTILLTLSNFLSYYSLEVRTYSLVFFLALLSTNLFFKFIEKPKIANLLLLSLVNFLIIYSHYISGIIIVIQYLFILIYYKKNALFFFSFQTIAICGLVFIRFTKKQFLNIFHFNDSGEFWLKTATFDDLLLTIKNLYNGEFIALFFTLGFLTFLYFYFMDKSQKSMKIQVYCFLLGICSVLFLFFLGLYKAVFLDRYLIFCIPFATILVSSQLVRFKTVGVYIFLIVFIFQVIYFKREKDSGMDYRGLAKLIKEIRIEKDLIIINTSDNLELFEYYMDKNIFLKYKNLDSLAKSQEIYAVNSIEEVNSISFPKNSRVFLIQSYHKINKTTNQIQEYLAEKKHQKYSSVLYNGIEFSVFGN